MIVYLANKTRLRADILSNRIEEIVHESFQGALGKAVGASDVFWVPALAIRSDDTLVVRTKKCATGVSPLPNFAELPDPFTAKPGFFLTQREASPQSRLRSREANAAKDNQRSLRGCLPYRRAVVADFATAQIARRLNP